MLTGACLPWIGFPFLFRIPLTFLFDSLNASEVLGFRVMRRSYRGKRILEILKKKKKENMLRILLCKIESVYVFLSLTTFNP